MQLFMDHLAIEELEKFFFVYKLPSRLKDTPHKLRAEVLTHLEKCGMVDAWMNAPDELRQVLRNELGRTDLALKIDDFVRKSIIQLRIIDVAIPKLLINMG